MDQAHQAIPSMEKEQCMIITYHEIRNISKEKAHELLRKVLEKNDCCVQKTAQILGICRKTVRRARDGTLSDYSQRPKNSPKKINHILRILLLRKACIQAMVLNSSLHFCTRSMGTIFPCTRYREEITSL